MIFMKLSSMLWAMPLAQSEGPVDGERVASHPGIGDTVCSPRAVHIFVTVVPSDLHPFGFGTVINFREKINSKCQKKKCAVFPKLPAPFSDKSGPTPLPNSSAISAHPPPTPKPTPTFNADSHLLASKAWFRWMGKFRKPNKLLHENFQAFSRLTACISPTNFLTAGNQDAEPGTSTQGRSIPQLLHAGVV